MAFALLVAVALLRLSQAARTSDLLDDIGVPNLFRRKPEADIGNYKCTEAQSKSHSNWEYYIGYEAAKGLRHNQLFHLKSSSNCTGEDLGFVSVIPWIHPTKPLEHSKATITLQPSPDLGGMRVFVCHAGPVQQGGPKGCIATIKVPQLGFAPHNLLIWGAEWANMTNIFNNTRWEYMTLSSTNEVVDMLEWVMLIIVLCFLLTASHGVYALCFRGDIRDLMAPSQATIDRISGKPLSTEGDGNEGRGEAAKQEEEDKKDDGPREGEGGGTSSDAVEDNEPPERARFGSTVSEAVASYEESDGDEEVDSSAPQRLSSMDSCEGGQTVQRSACPVNISSPFWDAIEVYLQSASFVVACTSLLGVLLWILRKIEPCPISTGVVTVCLIAWPASCGNYLLYWIWMTSFRLQLHSAALHRGIVIRGQKTNRVGSYVALFCIGTLLTCIGCTALLLLKDEDQSIKNISSVYLVNPLCTLLTMLYYFHTRIVAQRLTERPTAINRLAKLIKQKGYDAAVMSGQIAEPKARARTIGPFKMPSLPERKEPVQENLVVGQTAFTERLRAGRLTMMSEGAFCKLCRRYEDPVAELEKREPFVEENDDDAAFGFLDIAWHGKTVYRLSGHRIGSVNVLVAMFFVLFLIGDTVTFAITKFTAWPHLSKLTTAQATGVFNPPLKSWQTDYELLLDSTMHSCTFVAESTLHLHTTSKMTFQLPGGKSFNTRDSFALATVELDGSRHPMNVHISMFSSSAGSHLTGSTRSVTNYSIRVVKNYQMLLGAKLTGEGHSFERVIAWGELLGSVIAVPENASRMKVELLTVPFTLGIPVNESEAKAIASRGDGPKLQTVFRNMKNADRQMCRKFCMSSAPCMTFVLGFDGCWFVYGPISFLNFGAQIFEQTKEQMSRYGGTTYQAGTQLTLEARLCSRSKYLKEVCNNMKHTAPNSNALQSTVEVLGNSVHKATIHFFKHLDNRTVWESFTPKIQFTAGCPTPVGYLGYIDGLNVTAKRTSWARDRLPAFEVTLPKYIPSSYVTEYMLYLAILVPDSLFTVDPPKELNAEIVKAPPAEKFRTACSADFEYLQYSVCGGWRDLDIIGIKINPWYPASRPVNVTVRPKMDGYASTELTMTIRTFDGREPAEWAAIQNCTLDTRAMGQAESEDVLTVEVTKTFAKHCMNLTIMFRRHNWEPSLEEFVKDAIAYYMKIDMAMDLLAAAEANKGVKNYTKFLMNVGLSKCPPNMCLRIEDTAYGSKVLPLDLFTVVKHPNCTGRLVDAIASMEDPALVNAKMLTAAVSTRNAPVVRSIINWAKNGSSNVSIARDPQGSLYADPAVSAINQRNSVILDLLLQVTSACLTIADGAPSAVGIVKVNTLLEMAVAAGCAGCVPVLLKAGLAGDLLSFSSTTSPTVWRDGAAEALELVPVERLSFSGARTTVIRIITYFKPLAQRGMLNKLAYLTFHGSGLYYTDLQDNPKMFDEFCEMLQAMKGLKAIFLGSLYGTLGQAKRLLTCLSVLPNLQEIDMSYLPVQLAGSPKTVPIISQLKPILRNIRTLRKIHFSERYPKFAVEKVIQRRVLPQYECQSDRWDLAKAFRSRPRCTPKPGMQEERIDLESYDKEAKETADQVKALMEQHKAAMMAAARLVQTKVPKDPKEEFCKLDYSDQHLNETEAILLQRVVDESAEHCLELQVSFRDGSIEEPITRLAQEAIAASGDRNETFDTTLAFFNTVSRNRGANRPEVLKEMGFTSCGRQACLNFNTTDHGNTVVTLPFEKVVRHKNASGFFAEAVCEREDERKITVHTLDVTLASGSARLVRGTIACMRKRLGMNDTDNVSYRFKLDGSPIAPGWRSIVMQRHDLLTEVIAVTGACHVQRDGGIFGSTMLEIAVARGCANCVPVLLAYGMDPTRLAFGPQSSQQGAIKKASAALAHLKLERLSFTGSLSSPDWILPVLNKAATKGAFKNLQYINFYKVDENWFQTSVVKDKVSAFMLCRTLKAARNLRMALLGEVLASWQRAELLLRCFRKLPKLEELDFDPGSLVGPNNESTLETITELYTNMSTLKILHFKNHEDLRAAGDLARHFETRVDINEVIPETFKRLPCKDKSPEWPHKFKKAAIRIQRAWKASQMMKRLGRMRARRRAVAERRRQIMKQITMRVDEDIRSMSRSGRTGRRAAQKRVTAMWKGYSNGTNASTGNDDGNGTSVEANGDSSGPDSAGSAKEM